MCCIWQARSASSELMPHGSSGPDVSGSASLLWEPGCPNSAFLPAERAPAVKGDEMLCVCACVCACVCVCVCVLGWGSGQAGGRHLLSCSQCGENSTTSQHKKAASRQQTEASLLQQSQLRHQPPLEEASLPRKKVIEAAGKQY